jgi:hypothetical protein
MIWLCLIKQQSLDKSILWVGSVGTGLSSP